jgi:hypothetical protein
MFWLFEGASLKIAKNLIKVTGVQNTLTLFYQKNLSNVAPEDALKLILALNSCNLMQTMREDFINKEIDPEDRQDIVEDYVVENIRQLAVIQARDGAERMDKCMEIMDVSEKLRSHWMGEEDHTGPGPRYYAVKDVLRRLGNETNHDLHDALFEFVYTQHRHFIHYFKNLLEPSEGPLATNELPVPELPIEPPVSPKDPGEMDPNLLEPK